MWIKLFVNRVCPMLVIIETFMYVPPSYWNLGSGTPPKALRLNRVKHLARVLSSDITTTTAQNHNRETDGKKYILKLAIFFWVWIKEFFIPGEHNLPRGEHLMNSNLPKVVQTNNVNGGEEWLCPNGNNHEYLICFNIVLAAYGTLFIYKRTMTRDLMSFYLFISL